MEDEKLYITSCLYWYFCCRRFPLTTLPALPNGELTNFVGRWLFAMYLLTFDMIRYSLSSYGFLDGFQVYKPFATKLRPAGFFLSKKTTFLEVVDMYFVSVDMRCQYFFNIAKVTMGGSPKQG
jgi:hypothetical protein